MAIRVTSEEALDIIDNSTKILGVFYSIENGVYVGIDNTTGDAWTEEFDNLRSCIKWLRRFSRSS